MKWFITGGAGFIGSNVAKHLLLKDVMWFYLIIYPVEVSRANLEWLDSFGNPLLIEGDVRDQDALEHALYVHNDTEVVLHLAAQVAVTTSVINPRDDFEINAFGTFNLLEAIRKLGIKPIILNASTNKVYGSLSDISVSETKTRYCFTRKDFAVNENSHLIFIRHMVVPRALPISI